MIDASEPVQPSSAAFRAAMRLHVGGIAIVAVTAPDGACYNGVPLLRHARASFECVASEVIVRATHLLVIGTVTHLRIGARDDGALAYVDGKFLAVA